MADDRRLIEDFLPIQAISAEASREKSIRKGHISTLHLWWARRPLVACRAAVYGALVPASRFIPENGPDNKKQSLGRANAAKFIERLCKYPGNPTVIKEAQRHILEAHAERLTIETGKKVTVEDIEEGRAPRPKVLDMFAGGGAIPLEALRLGCEAYALDLNPVAHIIQLCTLVYPQKYGKPDPNVRGMTGPVMSGSVESGSVRAKDKTLSPTNAQTLPRSWGGLAAEVRYWGEWVLGKVKAEIGDLYPLIPDPEYKEKRGRTGVPPVIQGELFQTRRHLPHWQIGSSVYFITFSTRKTKLPETCRKTILDACRFWEGKKIRLHLVCVMPDHVHALMEPLEESAGKYHDLSKVLHSIKSFAAHEINKVIGRSGPLWEEESWDRIVRDDKDYYEKWEYILNNPVKAGLSESPEQYPFVYVNKEAAGRIPSGETGETPVLPPSGYLMPVAYLWTRTVRCKNPTCGATVPLVRQTWLCKKSGGKKSLGRYVALKVVAPKGEKKVRFEVAEATAETGLGFDPAGFSKGGNATCPFCGTVADSGYVKQEGQAGRLSHHQLMAVVCTRPGKQGKVYLSVEQASSLLESTSQRSQAGRLCHQPVPPDDEIKERIEELCRRTGLTVPGEPIVTDAKNSCWTYLYGLTSFGALFTPRQMLSLLSFAAVVREAVEALEREGIESERAKAVGTYLAVLVNRQADYNSSLSRWHNTGEKISATFGRQALPMVWDFCELAPFGDASGSPEGAINWIVGVVNEAAHVGSPATVTRSSATALPWPSGTGTPPVLFDAVITDPPYYDNVPYANISDFFYVWLKRTIGHIYPEHFATDGTPKKNEAVADAVRHGGSKEKARRAYERMMAQSFAEANRVLKPGGQMTVVYAHKTTLGWSTLVDALRRAGFTVTEAWPLNTEMKSRLRGMESAALASSIFLVARKREGASTGSYEDEVRSDLDTIVRERVDSLWKMGITGADLVIAAVGAGLRAFTRFSRVEYANGEEVPAEKFLAEVEGVVLETLLEKIFGEGGQPSRLSDGRDARRPSGRPSGISSVDGPTRFYVLWRYTYKAAEMDAGEAIVFTYGQNVELDGQNGLSSGSRALVEKKKGKYRLLDFSERGDDEKLGLPNTTGGTPVLPPLIDILHRILWLVENEPRKLNDFLDEARPDRERLRLVAQALAGTALAGRKDDGPEHTVATTPAEAAALNKLVANWRALIEARLSDVDIKTGQRKMST